MSQPIQRDGVWWHQKADGTWLRWNAPKSEWEAAPAPPPPPPAPTQAGGKPAAAGPDPVAKGREPAFGFSTAESDEPSSSDSPEGTGEVAWEFGEESGEPISFGPANADVLPPESDKPTASEWLNSNRAVAALVALVVLAAAVFAAFTFMGGDADSSGPAGAPSAIGEPVSKKAAARKLNGLCKSAKREIKSLGTPTSPDELVDYMTGVDRTYSSFLRDLGAIQPVPEIKVKFARLVRDFKQQSVYADDMLAAAKAGDLVTAQQKLQELEAESVKMNARARAFGADACTSA